MRKISAPGHCWNSKVFLPLTQPLCDVTKSVLLDKSLFRAYAFDCSTNATISTNIEIIKVLQRSYFDVSVKVI